MHLNFASAHSCGLRLAKKICYFLPISFASAHSCGLRRHLTCLITGLGALPQRIRAGCDSQDPCIKRLKGLCLSAFVRVATYSHPQKDFGGAFASAHSCGLRLGFPAAVLANETLPQRIRAGCDCEKAMERTANLLREGR